MADLLSTAGPRPAATLSIHRDFLESASPDWLVNATPERRAQLKATPAPVPDWYQQALLAQRQVLNEKTIASFTAQTALDKAMKPLQDIDTFAKPLLVKALQEQFKVQLDVNKTILQLRTRVEVRLPVVTYRTFDVVRLPLLQAALHNFEEWECKAGAFDASSGFVVEATQADTFEAVNTSLTVAQFTGLCRSLDIGAQYQRYLKDFVHPKDSVTEQALRHKFSAARKADLAAAAEQALLTKDIGPDDYRMLVSVINGENHPWMGTRQVWFRDLGLMRSRMTGCIAFVICEIRRYTNDLILYIPHDPHHPLKRVTYDQMQAIFKERFTARDTSAPDDGSPTAYQRFFSRFVRYGDLPGYFGELTDVTPAPGSVAGMKPYFPLLDDFLRGLNPFSVFIPVRDVPPDPAPIKRSRPDPFLNVGTMNQKGTVWWDDNLDLWDYLFEQHRDKLLADARSHAVPTADVDARVRSEKFAKLLSIGFMALNVVSMFVPVLGEVMMVVMAGQLLYETLEGSIEWAEGDRRAAKGHLVDVAENLAFLAVMAGGAKLLPKVIAVKPEPVIESLDPVTLPNGQQRLWRADLSGYESPVNLPVDVAPNPAGEYQHAGNSYIRQSGKHYEKTFDSSLNRWRIKHPTDTAAYQPPLSHNGSGAWRHTLERPQTWDRLTLMQRLGPVTEDLSNEQLLKIADISGISDATLRQVHLDNTTPPAPLADALRLFNADQDVARVIEQVGTGQAVDGRYLYSLPLITEMPRWPMGRVLEVFDEPSFSGPAQRYGVERLYHGVKLKAPIRISRADVLSSQLPASILAALDESEIVAMLGGESARVVANRPQELRKQLTDYARTRQPALFDSLYKGTELPDPYVAKLQRLYPGLSEHAARSVLADADSEQLGRFRSSGRVPLAMQENAHWQVRQGRMGHAYAGLHMENLVSADSKRLALHTLEKLPGWSDQLRLEVRDGAISGPLLDSIGSETAVQTKYLVKRGPQYQAFNERGEELNSVPRHGDNFYASLMHAMPDQARHALGLPHVGQSLELRRAIIDYATEHRAASTDIVEGASHRQRWFKPPQRISRTQVGYPASGRGQGGSPSLVSRVQDVYPQMTDGQANGFIFTQMLAGKTDAQIFTLLNNRMSEWRQLESTLNVWQMTESTDPFIRQYSILDSRPAMAQALKASWRNAPLAELPGLDQLNLSGDASLPELSADFSHVRTLSISGRGVIEGHIDRVLGYFPQVQDLTLRGASTSLSSVPKALERMSGLKRLKIVSDTELAADELARLEAMTSLEILEVHSTLSSSRPLDVSRLTKLRSLMLSGGGQRAFPLGAMGLPELQRLDLKHASIDQLPAELFAPGGEQHWSKLSVNWSIFNRERFKTAYDYVRSHPEHLMDQDEMVREYCNGVLSDGLGRTRNLSTPFSGPLNALFFERWSTAQAQFDAIEALSTEYAQLTDSLDHWAIGRSASPEGFNRSSIAYTLRTIWNEGLLQRYGLPQSATLTLPGATVSELPILPTTGFEHVTALHLQNARVPSSQMSRFIRGFSGVQRLDVSGSSLTELVLAQGEWPALEHLNLSNNALERLDVSGLEQLRSLGLRGTALTTWPTGAEHLPHLIWLDLRDTRLTQLPAAALAQDRLVLDTHLAGVPLSPQGQADLTLARQRVEQVLGLDDATLSRFEQQAFPDVFPPGESGSDLARQLLAVPVDNPVEAALTRRLNGWLFTRRYTLGRDLEVSSSTRKIAASRLLESWRNSLAGAVGAAGNGLEFHGLVLGELPELPVVFEHIERLNLSGVQITGQGSNGFLSAFPNLSSLVLNSNPLGVLPSALNGMARLERLGLSGGGISDPELMYPTLRNLAQLHWLDVSYCGLDTFRLDALGTVEELNLSNNELTSWPQGTLQATALHSLDLSSNELSSIPQGALEGEHDALMDGVDLSDNFNLPLDDLYRLQAYAERISSNRALGFSSADVQQLINDLEHPQPSSDEEGSIDAAPVLPDEVLGDAHTDPAFREPWLKNLPPDEQTSRIALWDQLAHEPDNAAFFNLLSLLPQTKEFDAARASLTKRVWRVMDAAASDTELRQTLFGMSGSHGTCTDGRILTFSGLEIKVLEFETLVGIDPTDLPRKGPVLLKLSRNLFRLEQVEKLADRHIRPNSDAAEVRLQYLIGLRRRLDLEGVPEKMRYAIPISGAGMEEEAKAIETLEKTDAFHENLISRDYWVDYLKERYPEDVIALEQRKAQQRDALEDAYTSVTDEGYLTALQAQEYQLQADETQTLMALSRRADRVLNPAAYTQSQPGTSSGSGGMSTT